MNPHEVRKALAAIEKSPAPNRATPYFNGEEVTGYSWQWGVHGDYVSVNVRIRPDQRDKIGDKVTLHITLDDVSISGSNGGSAIGSGGSYQLSFTVARSKPLGPIEGLEDMLNDVLKVPLNI